MHRRVEQITTDKDGLSSCMICLERYSDASHGTRLARHFLQASNDYDGRSIIRRQEI
jgi:hypothetical protein